VIALESAVWAVVLTAAVYLFGLLVAEIYERWLMWRLHKRHAAKAKRS
jgi:hypothetical protein